MKKRSAYGDVLPAKLKMKKSASTKVFSKAFSKARYKREMRVESSTLEIAVDKLAKGPLGRFVRKMCRVYKNLGMGNYYPLVRVDSNLLQSFVMAFRRLESENIHWSIMVKTADEYYDKLPKPLALHKWEWFFSRHKTRASKPEDVLALQCRVAINIRDKHRCKTFAKLAELFPESFLGIPLEALKALKVKSVIMKLPAAIREMVLDGYDASY